ncbi:DUF1611 domain-containing protein [Halosimplex salinum]|uniref:DUF1611 domain-containing protein n=1 Tax=Halosimplex salinum TaxID=1710538 RepID=UPI000F48BD9A|nr:DUF1611 domain-containing protein [Halosimplex salinum]
MRVAILAHEQFPDRAKTAVGVLRYGDDEVAAVLDRTHAGERVRDHVPDVQDAPIVGGIDDVDEPIDALLIGIAPIGGGFDETWRPDVRGALERGCDVVAGLHYFLADDDEFARLADEHGCELRDLRRPPEDLTVSDGTASEVDADVVLTVGTDCSSGKMTTTFELAAAARERGVDAGVVPTGQTGIVVEDYGIAVDRVISDFAAGATERMVEERAADYDVLFVEGQGAVGHPAYSGVTTSILHGAMPDRLVLCHVAGREAVHGYEQTPIPPPSDYAALYESLADPVAPAEVVAGALDTHHLDDDAAGAAVEAYGDALDAPATDPVRFDAAEILPAALGEE